jgi:hypothetical protein
MSNVEKLKLVAVEPDVNMEVVDLLTDFLGQAKRGEIRNIAIAAVRQNGKARTASSAGVNVSEILGALEIIRFRILSGSDIL